MHCGFNFHGAILKNDAGEIRYYTDGGYHARGISVCRSTHIQAAALDEFVMQRLSAIIPADEKAIAAATQRFMATRSAKIQPQDNGSAVEKELAAVNRRIKTLVATLADGDLNDLPEVKQALMEMKRRRDTLEARQANTASPAVRFTDEQTNEWATATLRDLAGALRGRPTSETLRRVVHNCVDRIEIDPEAKQGRLFLPADTCSLLQLSASRRGTSASAST